MSATQDKTETILAEIKTRYRNVFRTPFTCLDKGDRLSIECNHGDMQKIGQLCMGLPSVKTYTTCDVFKKGRVTVFLK